MHADTSHVTYTTDCFDRIGVAESDIRRHHNEGEFKKKKSVTVAFFLLQSDHPATTGA